MRPSRIALHLPQRSLSDAALLAAAVVVVLAMVVAGVTGRAVPDLDARARGLESQLRCPTCQGLSIADSPATAAGQMRALVREQLGVGATDDEVRSFFVTRYGRWILLDPPAAGIDLALWLIPAGTLALGAIVAIRRARTGGRILPHGGWSTRARAGSRLSSGLVVVAMALALAAPIAAAIGPRLTGQTTTGRTLLQATPSIDDLEAFVRAQPGDVEALVALGDALLDAGRAPEAVDRYRAALEIDPQNARALVGMGVILLGADRPDAAVLAFDRALAAAPDQSHALLYRGLARLRLEGGVTAGVAQDLNRFLALADPADPLRQLAIDGLAGSLSAPSASAAAPSRR